MSENDTNIEPKPILGEGAPKLSIQNEEKNEPKHSLKKGAPKIILNNPAEEPKHSLTTEEPKLSLSTLELAIIAKSETLNEPALCAYFGLTHDEVRTALSKK